MKFTFAFVGLTSFFGFIMLQDMNQDTFAAYADKLSLITFMAVVIWFLVNYLKKKEEIIAKKEEKLNNLLIEIAMQAFKVSKENVNDFVSKIEDISKKEN